MTCWSKIKLLDQGLHLYCLTFFTYIVCCPIHFYGIPSKRRKNKDDFKWQARKCIENILGLFLLCYPDFAASNMTTPKHDQCMLNQICKAAACKTWCIQTRWFISLFLFVGVIMVLLLYSITMLFSPVCLHVVN